MKNEIGAFEAKTRLSELLRETERGRSFAIRRRGKVVARLVPPGPEEGEPMEPDQVWKALREIRKRVPGPVRVRELIDEGRRH